MGRKFQKVAFEIVKCSFCYTILRNTLNNLGFLISLSDGISGLDRNEITQVSSKLSSYQRLHRIWQPNLRAKRLGKSPAQRGDSLSQNRKIGPKQPQNRLGPMYFKLHGIYS